MLHQNLPKILLLEIGYLPVGAAPDLFVIVFDMPGYNRGNKNSHIC
jgi:hypothetical protein